MNSISLKTDSSQIVDIENLNFGQLILYRNLQHLHSSLFICLFGLIFICATRFYLQSVTICHRFRLIQALNLFFDYIIISFLVILHGWHQIRLRGVASRPVEVSLGVPVHPRRRPASGVVFAGAQFNIILLPQGLFIPCFLQFAILQVRRTSSPSLRVSDTLGRVIASIMLSAYALRCRWSTGYLGINLLAAFTDFARFSMHISAQGRMFVYAAYSTFVPM